MPYLVSCATPGRRRSTALALLASVAASALLGGCTTGPLLGKGDDPLSAARLADSGDPQTSGAAAQWAAAYAKKPNDPQTALGYARALKAIGSRDQALEVLKVSYQTGPTGEVAAELGRLALDMGRLDIAKATLRVAEAQGVHDWKTLSAQGTLRAKQGQHAEAQQYFMAALQLEPDSASVINNLALSYALDNKADRAEELLRTAMQKGHGDKRLRQNLALVLGLEGKFDESRKIASVDLPEADARANMAYLRNMLTKTTEVASLGPDGPDEVDAVPDGEVAQDWEPFAAKAAPVKPVANASPAKPKAKPVHVAAAAPVASAPVPARKPGPMQAATPAPKNALLPAETGSSTVAKSTPSVLAAKPPAKGAEPDPTPITLLRNNIE